MTRQEVVSKLRELANEVENPKKGSPIDFFGATWNDFELEKFSIVGRPGKGAAFMPVLTCNTDLGVIRVTELDNNKDFSK